MQTGSSTGSCCLRLLDWTDRDPDVKGRAVARHRIERERAVVLVDDDRAGAPQERAGVRSGLDQCGRGLLALVVGLGTQILDQSGQFVTALGGRDPAPEEGEQRGVVDLEVGGLKGLLVGGRGGLVGARQSIDAFPVLEGLVGPDTLGDQNAPPLAGAGLRMEEDFSPGAAEPRLTALVRGILARMN